MIDMSDTKKCQHCGDYIEWNDRYWVHTYLGTKHCLEILILDTYAEPMGI